MNFRTATATIAGAAIGLIVLVDQVLAAPWPAECRCVDRPAIAPDEDCPTYRATIIRHGNMCAPVWESPGGGSLPTPQAATPQATPEYGPNGPCADCDPDQFKEWLGSVKND
jgi:hypothetical protein